MANTQVNVSKNGTTTLITAGKYCDKNIDVKVAVPASNVVAGTITITENGTHDVTNYASAKVNVAGGQASQFTNLYNVNNVIVQTNLTSSQTKNTAVAMETYNYGNVLKIPYSHAAGDSVVLRLRGIGTVRDRFQCVITDASDLVVTWGQLSNANTLTYDEYGDACLTLSSPYSTNAWEYLYFVFQYPGVNSKVTEAKTGPIITINEPIGNGGYVG